MELEEYNPAKHEHQRHNVSEYDSESPSWFYQNQHQGDKKDRVDPTAEQDGKVLKRRLMQDTPAVFCPGHLHC